MNTMSLIGEAALLQRGQAHPDRPLPRIGAIAQPATICRCPADRVVASCGGHCVVVTNPARVDFHVDGVDAYIGERHEVERPDSPGQQCWASQCSLPWRRRWRRSRARYGPLQLLRRGQRGGPRGCHRSDDVKTTVRRLDARCVELVEHLDERCCIARGLRLRYCRRSGSSRAPSQRHSARRSASRVRSRARPQWLWAAPVKWSWAPNNTDRSWFPVATPGSSPDRTR